MVIVATLRALKFHGGVDVPELSRPNLAAVEKGVANLERHVNNIRNHYGLPCIISINHFVHDTEEEIALLKRKMAHHDAPVLLARHWAEGGKGAEEVARAVVKMVDTVPTDFTFVYWSSAYWPKSRPKPLCLYPPNGDPVSNPLYVLIQTEPALICAAMRCAS